MKCEVTFIYSLMFSLSVAAMTWENFESTVLENDPCLLVTVAPSSNDTLMDITYSDRVMIHWKSIYLRFLEENTPLRLVANFTLFMDVHTKIMEFHR